MTGYDLFKQFESSVGYVWHAPDSQIYPELRRMAREGLLEGHEVPWGARGRKVEYHVTERGLEDFRSWMNQDLEYSRERDPAHLKAAYMEWAEPDSARRQMRAHRDYYAARRAQWAEKVREIDEGTSAMLNKRLAGLAEADRPRAIAFKRYTYQGLVARADQEISWAEQGLDLIDSLDDSHL
jgi:PadR family transcriptional regulator AphA